ncbi:flagellar hook-length control protein FliK [Paenibacillus radicis (ex Gao et al. 2016)]|uniref:Flagellar hook-length control protein FliK n=1 Tax=Paenibacillus radicis (ex Gao et al. 2016) TaxID=1737354 RepID=A0A917HKB6_9BACL|nr:flagellar hook-length control protein FliK [Paenibacillus radicis (ex Gao et al. 2016)]GGG80957.1 hypothetical protein GCM10010918_42700 [Paenibacillus radicis (ex Gao et al. 2016)]
MNINQMMKSFLGDASAGEARTMELKAGQVVRGQVMQVMDNNEAIVQINGVQVRAKLELPLQQGQTAMLQVQSQSLTDGGNSMIVLKQVETGTAALPDNMVKDLVKLLGLPDQKWATELVKELRREGFPMNRETAQLFQQALSAMPKGVNAEQWMQAAAAAIKRGLPVTAGTISAMQQVMFGRSAHELLDALHQQLANALGEGGAAGSKSQLPQLAARLQALLSEGGALMRAAAETSVQPPAGGSANAPASGGGNAGAGAAPAVNTAAGAANALVSNAANASAASASNTANVTGAATTAVGQSTGGAAVAPASPSSQPSPTAGNLAAGANTAAVQQQAAGSEAAAASSPTSTPSPSAGGATGSSGNWLGQMMKWMGVDYENQLLKQFPPTGGSPTGQQPADTEVSGQGAAQKTVANTDLPAGSAARTTVQAGAEGNEKLLQPTAASLQEPRITGVSTMASSLAAEPGMQEAAAAPKALTHESLKSVLLAIAASDDAPAALKETAQQLVQQVTGQQLLLTPERNGSMFSHLTMFIPLNGPNGDQTASVQIQTRRGRKGELDANNCRLLFHLSMKTLGDTIVDVNVVDKIVSLNLWNDHPAISALVESARTEVSESLSKAGYQLSSLRTTPTFKGDLSADSGGSDKLRTAEPAPISATAYKGVDFRV